MVSGDMHTLTYDSGEYNAYGNFPIFHCAPLDKRNSCEKSGWSDGPFNKVGQYCNFEIRKLDNGGKTCIAFKGY